MGGFSENPNKQFRYERLSVIRAGVRGDMSWNGASYLCQKGAKGGEFVQRYRRFEQGRRVLLASKDESSRDVEDCAEKHFQAKRVEGSGGLAAV